MTHAATLTAALRQRAADLHAGLTQQLTELGRLVDPGWRAAFERIPRHVLVPSFFEPDPAGGWRQVDGSDPRQQEHWLGSVYADQTLIIAVADVPIPPAAGGGSYSRWTSSSTAPGLVMTMLHALEVEQRHRVLEIGTGPGYNAALLCARVGGQRVASIDIDPALVEAAGDRIAAVGHRPTLRNGDGTGGLAEQAPYDRLIATCAVRAIPPAWLEQLAPGGVILTDLRGRIGGTLVKLRRQPDGTVSGRFLPGYASFMWLRHTPGVAAPAGSTALPTAGTGAPQGRLSAVDPDLLLDDPGFSFVAQLHLPDGRLAHTTRLSDGAPTLRITLTDGSWCEVLRTADRDGRYQVTEAGPRAAWAIVEEAYGWWHRHGRPPCERFGVTASPDRQEVWCDHPDSDDRWPLPDPGEPAPGEE